MGIQEGSQKQGRDSENLLVTSYQFMRPFMATGVALRCFLLTCVACPFSCVFACKESTVATLARERKSERVKERVEERWKVIAWTMEIYLSCSHYRYSLLITYYPYSLFIIVFFVFLLRFQCTLYNVSCVSVLLLLQC